MSRKNLVNMFLIVSWIDVYLLGALINWDWGWLSSIDEPYEKVILLATFLLFSLFAIALAREVERRQ